MPSVLYSFPFRIGSERICSTAGYQVVGAATAGTQMTVLSGSVGRTFPENVHTRATLAAGNIRLPIRYLGTARACRLHDWRVARWLQRNSSKIDLIHGWPLASLKTMRVAKKLGIPFLLERPNAHTAYAYEATAAECLLLGIKLPEDHDHGFNQDFLDQEEQEYAMADFLLCPSEFVAKTFRDRNYNAEKILRHRYGFDETRFIPRQKDFSKDRGLVMIYVGVCEPRKGLHYALEAWLQSGAHELGKFLICGDFVPGYKEKLQPMINHPSVAILGHRKDVPELMGSSDLFVLSSVEEGSALVTYEAKGSGCVLLVSDGAGAVCEHLVDSMIHPIRDVNSLANHIRCLNEDRLMLLELRKVSLQSAAKLRWKDAGIHLAEVYAKAFNRADLSLGRSSCLSR